MRLTYVVDVWRISVAISYYGCKKYKIKTALE